MPSVNSVLSQYVALPRLQLGAENLPPINREQLKRALEQVATRNRIFFYLCFGATLALLLALLYVIFQAPSRRSEAKGLTTAAAAAAMIAIRFATQSAREAAVSDRFIALLPTNVLSDAEIRRVVMAWLQVTGRPTRRRSTSA